MKLPIVKDWSCCQSAQCCYAGPRVSADEYALLRTRRDVSAVQLADGFFMIQGQPCPFLEGTRCSVYDIRPYKCRQYQCHRPPGEPFDATGKILDMRLRQSRTTRRAYALNQRHAAHWALKHGWTGTER